MEEKLNIIITELGNLNKGQNELLSRSDKMENGRLELMGRSGSRKKDKWN
jgi:hypothetical protein